MVAALLWSLCCHGHCIATVIALLQSLTCTFGLSWCFVLKRQVAMKWLLMTMMMQALALAALTLTP